MKRELKPIRSEVKIGYSEVDVVKHSISAICFEETLEQADLSRSLPDGQLDRQQVLPARC